MRPSLIFLIPLLFSCHRQTDFTLTASGASISGSDRFNRWYTASSGSIRNEGTTTLLITYPMSLPGEEKELLIAGFVRIPLGFSPHHAAFGFMWDSGVSSTDDGVRFEDRLSFTQEEQTPEMAIEGEIVFGQPGEEHEVHLVWGTGGELVPVDLSLGRAFAVDLRAEQPEFIQLDVELPPLGGSPEELSGKLLELIESELE